LEQVNAPKTYLRKLKLLNPIGIETDFKNIVKPLYRNVCVWWAFWKMSLGDLRTMIIFDRNEEENYYSRFWFFSEFWTTVTITNGVSLKKKVL